MERVIFRVNYEILPDWCAVYGPLGHQHKECGDGVHAPKALVFKDIKVTWFKGPGSEPSDSGSSRRGRGRGRSGRGRGRSSSSRGPYDEQYEEEREHQDRDVAMADVDRNRKRGLMIRNPHSQLLKCNSPSNFFCDHLQCLLVPLLNRI